MSTEAFIWNYKDGEPIGFAFDVVRDILATKESDWNSNFGCLNVRFGEPTDIVSIYLGRNAPETNQIDGIMIARPIVHPEYLRRIFQVLELGNAMMFHSDETTPIFVRGADPTHYPADLLRELGPPRFIDSPLALLHRDS